MSNDKVKKPKKLTFSQLSLNSAEKYWYPNKDIQQHEVHGYHHFMENWRQFASFLLHEYLHRKWKLKLPFKMHKNIYIFKTPGIWILEDIKWRDIVSWHGSNLNSSNIFLCQFPLKTTILGHLKEILCID